MDKHIEELINNAMLSSLEGYAFLVADSIEFELGRKLTTTEHQQVFVAVEHVASGNSALLAKLEAAEKERDELKELNRHFDLSIRKTEGVNEVLRSKLEAAERALIKPLPIGELIHRLEGQTYGKWFPESEVKDLRERAEAAEARLLVSVKLPDDGLEDCINMWPNNWRNDFDTGYNFGVWRCDQNIKAAGFKVEGE